MSRFQREQEFWDERPATLAECLDEVAAGPDQNTALAIQLLKPLVGVTVLDVGCGAGVLSAWLALAGANVTGIDISAAQIARATELHEALGLDTRFLVAPLPSQVLRGECFDRLAGRWVLHHLDPPSIAPELASLLHPPGKAAFVETMGLNPILRVARSRLTGRYGIPRYGNDDERPLTRDDLDVLRRAFGGLELHIAQMQFLRIFDRQVLHFRSPEASRLLGTLDDVLLMARLGRWSYHQVVFLSRDQPA